MSRTDSYAISAAAAISPLAVAGRDRDRSPELTATLMMARGTLVASAPQTAAPPERLLLDMFSVSTNEEGFDALDVTDSFFF